MSASALPGVPRRARCVLRGSHGDARKPTRLAGGLPAPPSLLRLLVTAAGGKQGTFVGLLSVLTGHLHAPVLGGGTEVRAVFKQALGATFERQGELRDRCVRESSEGGAKAAVDGVDLAIEVNVDRAVQRRDQVGELAG